MMTLAAFIAGVMVGALAALAGLVVAICVGLGRLVESIEDRPAERVPMTTVVTLREVPAEKSPISQSSDSATWGRNN